MPDPHPPTFLQRVYFHPRRTGLSQHTPNVAHPTRDETERLGFSHRFNYSGPIACLNSVASGEHWTSNRAFGHFRARAEYCATRRTERTRGDRLALLCLASLGIVYGDLGTSPLYALRECFYGQHAIAPTDANVLGVLSLILWSLLLIISVKYLTFILRADNRGEGGILALATLVASNGEEWPVFFFF